MGHARWDAVAGEFVEHYTQLYGQVRTHVLHAHLMQHLPAPPAERVAERVRLVEADGERAPQLLGERYDGVLCHGVLMYVDDPIPLVTALCQLVRRGGIVSVVTKNRRTLAVRYGVRHFTEGWARDRPAVDPVDDVLAVELEASRRDPYRQLSRLFHLLGRRRSA